jgi:hypothetical protein
VKVTGISSSLVRRQLLRLSQVDLWRVGAVFFLCCFVLSTVSFLMLEGTYKQVKDIVYRQQADIIKEQSQIILQQDQAIRELTGDNSTRSLKAPPTY